MDRALSNSILGATVAVLCVVISGCNCVEKPGLNTDERQLSSQAAIWREAEKHLPSYDHDVGLSEEQVVAKYGPPASVVSMKLRELDAWLRGRLRDMKVPSSAIVKHLNYTGDEGDRNLWLYSEQETNLDCNYGSEGTSWRYLLSLTPWVAWNCLLALPPRNEDLELIREHALRVDQQIRRFDRGSCPVVRLSSSLPNGA